MADGMRKGDHVVVVGKSGDVALVDVHHTDGTSETGLALVNQGSSGSLPASHCPAAGNTAVYHIGGNGPPMVNSPKYCAEYERIFGSKHKRGDLN